MSDARTVLIASRDLLPALRERTKVPGDVLTFSDPLSALEAITKTRPEVIALERLFAATSRGVAFLNRIRADPTLMDSEIRVIAHDSDYVRVTPRRATAAATPQAAVAVAEPPVTLDLRGTRRAPRYRVQDGLEILLDGNAAKVIDLSMLGAQVLSSSVLRPNQKIRVGLADPIGSVRCKGSVAWASYEIPKGAPRYRAGVELLDADAQAVDAFCNRYRVE